MTRARTKIAPPTCPAWCAADGHQTDLGGTGWRVTHEATVGNVGAATVTVQRVDQYDDGEGLRIGREAVLVDPGDALLTAEEAAEVAAMLTPAAAVLAEKDGALT